MEQVALCDTPARSFDPLGDAYCARHPPDQRRKQGVTLTPEWLVHAMLDRAAACGRFDTVVDPGAGTGRFTLAAAERFPQARVIAVEQDPELAALLAGRVRSAGLQRRVEIVRGDFRDMPLLTRGRTLYVGNPPYVRHHEIEPPWKQWYQAGMAVLGIPASQLGGLHAHFLLRIHQLMRPGDRTLLVTAAEWLDNRYGGALRQLLAGPAGLSLDELWLADTGTRVFDDALVSACVLGALAAPSAADATVRCGLLRDKAMQAVRTRPLAWFGTQPRWSDACRPHDLQLPAGIEVGDWLRVVRGQVTGMNAAWVLPAGDTSLPAELTLPSVTRASEIIDGVVIQPDAPARLKRVINLPPDLDTLPAPLREAADAALARARASGAHLGFIARTRRAWYAVEMRQPPLGFVSYMARRAPVFRANPHRVSYLNIAHGLYPREGVALPPLDRLFEYLNTHTRLESGRVYGGGLAKFEPSDVMRLRFPPHLLDAAGVQADGLNRRLPLAATLPRRDAHFSASCQP